MEKIIKYKEPIKQHRYVLFPIICLFILLFIIPDLFVHRHITFGILSINIIAILLTFWSLSGKKAIIITESILLVGIFVLYWTLSLFYKSGSSPSEQITFLSLSLFYIAHSQYAFYRKDLYNIYWILSFAGTSMAIWGILQHLHWVNSYNPKYPITGNFDNPAGIAIFLGIVLPYSLFFITRNNRWIKAWGILSSFIISCVIIASGSRTGILIIILLFFLILNQIKINLQFLIFLRKFLWITIVISILLLIGLYFLKVDSANGRILIWICSWNLFWDHWLVGTGGGGFLANYMGYQADYFQQNPDSMFKLLADNVQNPFNEFLGFGVEYGIIGLFLLGLFIKRIINIFQQSEEKRILHPVFVSLLALVTASCFSYPFDYPLICLVLTLNLAIVATRDKCIYKIRTKQRLSIIRILGFGICILFLIWTCNWIQAERKWFKLTYSLSPQKWKEYQYLHERLCNDGMFLYNYGAELHKNKQHEESLKILTLCIRYFNDYDVQLLFADNFYQLGNLLAAKQYYLEAKRMCPNRFLPLYHLVKIYELQGNRKMVEETVIEILKKEVKIPSIFIDKIKNEMYYKYNDFFLKKDDF